MKNNVLTRNDISYVVEGISLDHIINYNEILILEVMQEVYAEDSSICNCSLCIEDIYALSLNKISPRYIQSTSVDIYKASKNYIGKDLVKANVLEAVKMVKDKPGCHNANIKK